MPAYPLWHAGTVSYGVEYYSKPPFPSFFDNSYLKKAETEKKFLYLQKLSTANNMTKRILTTLVCLSCMLLCMAQAVTADEARQKALTFLTQQGKTLSSASHRVMRRDAGRTAAPFYVFNASDGGYVIVSGDERTEAILGYTDEGVFDEDRLPDNMKAWLDGYTAQISALQESQTATAPLRVPTHTAIRPLLTSRWDQGAANSQGNAYNKMCPKIDGVYCVTGCVATAMAQVMRYHRWPETFTTTIPEYTPNTDIGKLSALSATRFDWANMLDRYKSGETQTQQNAVARLMRYCGQAVQMEYGTGVSSAIDDYVAMALRTYFGYGVTVHSAQRGDYTATTWDELIYSELKARRPVFYSGDSSGGGHAFVCDGYDGQGFYHINWGWGGYHDGYYKLSILNPDGGGTGASGTNDGYAMGQTAIVGIQKPAAGSDDQREMALDSWGQESNSTIFAWYANRTGMKGTFDIGFALDVMDDDTDDFIVINNSCDADPLYMYYTSIDLNSLDLPDGTYRLYPFSRLSGSSSYHVPGDFTFYYEFTIRGGTVATITRHPQPKLALSSVKCVSNKVVNMPQEIQVTMTNSGEESNGLVYLFASQSRSQKGEAVNKTGMVVEAGSSETVSLFFTPNATGTWYVWADTDENGKSGYSPTTVVIRSLPTAQTKLQLISYDIDAKPETTVRMKVRNVGTDGYFMPFHCYLFVPEDDWNIDYCGTGYMNLAAGREGEVTFNFQDLTVGQTYYIGIFYHTDHTSGETANLLWSEDFVVKGGGLKGDADGSGKVDVTDVMCIVDYVLGKRPSKFIFNNADMDGKGTVDISDAMSIVNIILSKE